MKKVLITLVVLGAHIAAHAGEVMDLNFTNNAKELFEKGTQQEHALITQQPYRWVGGNFNIAISYEVSVINENLKCFKRLPLNTADAVRAEIQNLSLPPMFSCSTKVDIEKR